MRIDKVLPFRLLPSSAFSHPYAARLRVRQGSSGRRAIYLLPAQIKPQRDNVTAGAAHKGTAR